TDHEIAVGHGTIRAYADATAIPPQIPQISIGVMNGYTALGCGGTQLLQQRFDSRRAKSSRGDHDLHIPRGQTTGPEFVEQTRQKLSSWSRLQRRIRQN